MVQKNYKALLETERWSYAKMSPLTAFILVNTKIGKEGNVSQRIDELIKNMGDIKGGKVYSLFGEYDMIVVVEAEDIETIDKFVTAVRKLDDVVRTTTLVSSD
ncbi:MAG: Lrp/AsnC ligand binding domain-containing protein [Fervidicoccaceae archaeon]